MARQSEGRRTTLLAQDLALSAYLDALLQTSTEQAREEVNAEATETVVPSRALALVPAAAKEPAADDALPEWAREKFQCLLFYVGSLKLAVPLVKLTRIQPWGDHVTATPGRPDWFLGLLAQEGGRTGVIDTGRLVFPRDRRSQAAEQEHESEPGHILLVEGGRWGLTCDSLGEVIELRPEAVRWRTQRTARRWLAGTVRDQMCALLDVEVLARMVAEDESVLA